ncbi:MAG: hypothetical protein ACD_62C00267G0002 [uncultured bacterium]|nr:MAG: hypothetical protein ACD_62C00267G0002 [uncultured bacterium]HLD43897.1 CRISPR-associated endonuclease Cas2 [bacterium]
MRNPVYNTLAVYDIADVKRLARVAKIVKDYGERVQKSVFELFVSTKELRELHNRVNRVIDVGFDSVRYYFVCETDWQKREYLGVNKFVDEDWNRSFMIV